MKFDYQLSPSYDYPSLRSGLVWRRIPNASGFVMVHVLFGPEVRLMLDEDDKEGMRTFCETLHPATIAEALTDEFDIEQAWRFLEHTSIPNQAAIFEYFPLDWQVKMVEGTGRQHMARLIEQMSHDDRAELLRRLAPPAAEGLLAPGG